MPANPATCAMFAGLSAAVAEVQAAYRALWGVAKLRAVWGLAALLLTYRLGEGQESGTMLSRLLYVRPGA